MEQIEKIQDEAVNQENLNDEEFDMLQIIGVDVLDSVFLERDQKAILNGLKELKEFIKSNKPSYQVITDIFRLYFEIKEDIQKQVEQKVEKLDFTFEKLRQNLVVRFDELLPLFGKANSNSVVYKSLINIIIENKQYIPEYPDLRKQLNMNLLKKVNIDALPAFIKNFQLQDQIPVSEQEKYVRELIKQNKFQECFSTIQAFGGNEDLAGILINSMCNNKLASKGADFLKKFKLDPKKFPELKIRLEKNCIRHYLRDKQWYQIEDMFAQKPNFLGYASEDYYYKGMKNEAYSIIKRHDLINKGYVTKKDILDSIKGEEQLENLEVIENEMILKDCLNPLEETIGEQPKGAHLNLKDFGIEEKDIYYLDSLKDQKQFDEISQLLLQSTEIGLDTEFSSTYTKLDEQTESEVSLLQLANETKIVLIDMYVLKKSGEDLTPLKKFMENLFNGKQIKAGVAIGGDFKKICSNKCLGIKNSVQSFLELQTLYKKEHKNQRQSSLNHIAQTILGKPISKGEQTSNWLRRPLRKCQIHYAAMDAIVSVKIIEQLKKKLGHQVVQSYISDLSNSNYNEDSSDDKEDF